jgi:hypothetical protein
MPATSVEAYSKACTRILEVLAATSYYIDWESALYIMAQSLTDMARLLNVASLVSSFSFSSAPSVNFKSDITFDCSSQSSDELILLLTFFFVVLAVPIRRRS